MIPLGFSWGAFFVYVIALVIVTGGGLLGLFASGHPAFLAPTLMGLFYFYLCWEAVCEDSIVPGPPGGHKQGGK